MRWPARWSMPQEKPETAMDGFFPEQVRLVPILDGRSAMTQAVGPWLN